MGISDIIIATFVLGGACYLLYLSIWKKKGFCHGSGCDGSCHKK
jgi:hypothetical protein